MQMLKGIVVDAAQRAGTAVGTALGTYGVASADVEYVIGVIPVIAGVVFDIALRSFFKKRAMRG